MVIFAKYSKIDYLINNAGVFSNFLLENLSSDEFDRILRVNIKGAFLCSKEFARINQTSAKGKVIINIASVDALNPSCVGQVHYTSSKHAVAGLTKGLSVELAPKGMRVCAVCPGAALTEGAIELVQAGAPAVLFLVSPMAASITGILLPVDGGISSQTFEGYTN